MPNNSNFTPLYVRPATASKIKDLAARDHRPVWALVRDALAYYEKVHGAPRTPPASPLSKRGRPKRDKHLP